MARATRTTTSTTPKIKAGITAGLCAAVLLQPFDVVKTLQQDPAWSRSGVVETARAVARKHGARELWRGTTPTVIRVVPGAALYFVMVDSVTAALPPNASGFWPNITVGFVSRAVVAVALSPITLVKTRMETTGFNEYRSTLSALRSIAQKEKVSGLFAGAGATMARDAPYSGLYYGFYRYAQGVVADLGLLPGGATVENMVSSAAAGFTAAVITHPPDVIKTRVQVGRPTADAVPGHTGRRWNSLDTAAAMVRNEGPGVFFTGLTTRLSKRVLSATITWTLYEELVRFFGGS